MPKPNINPGIGSGIVVRKNKALNGTADAINNLDNTSTLVVDSVTDKQQNAESNNESSNL